jgi:hypothetical protein
VAAVVSARAKVLLALAAAAAALAYGLWVRDLPAPLAAVVALAIGALAFMAARALDRLRPLYRRRGERPRRPSD